MSTQILFKVNGIFMCILAGFSTANASTLYPQRQQNPAPVQSDKKSGYTAHTEKQWQSQQRPLSAAPKASVTRAATDIIEFIPAPAHIPATSEPSLSAKAATTPEPTIERQGVLPTLGKATENFNRKVEYGGSVEAGAQFSTGNTETQNVNLAAKLTRTSQDWVNYLTARLANAEAEGEQAEEEYRLSLGSEYQISDADFFFGEAEYVDDRFSGYDYRIQEVFGYGRHWSKENLLIWNSQIGAGFQHTKTRDAKRDDAPLLRLENTLQWQIAEKLSAENRIRVDVSDLTILRTESALKNHLYGDLYLKLGLVTEWLSDVPEGRKNLDIDTTLNLAYEF